MAAGMLDGLLKALNIGADIEIPKEEAKDNPPEEEKKPEEEKHDDPGNLPKDMSPYNVYGPKFDEWVKTNRPDFKRA